MSENRRRILDMLAGGKISADEAERLLAAMEQPAGGEAGTAGSEQAGKKQPKFLRVVVGQPEGTEPGGGEQRVNVRVPMALLRAGMKFASVIPAAASTQINEKLKEQGLEIDIRDIKLEDLEKLVDALSELEVDVGGPRGESVRIYFE